MPEVLAPVAPPDQTGTKTEGGLGFKLPQSLPTPIDYKAPDFRGMALGWDEHPQTEQTRKELAQKHYEEAAPVVQALANPNNPQSNIEASKKIDSVISAEKFRPSDFFTALGKGDIGGMIIAATGGSDVPKEAWDGAGRPYFKVYNQRGELKGITRNETGTYNPGTFLRKDELEGLGPIASNEDHTPQTTGLYKAQGLSAPMVIAQATNERNRNLLQSRAIANNADAGLHSAQEKERLAKNLVTASASPQELAAIELANKVTSINGSSRRQAISDMNSFDLNHADSKTFDNAVKKNAALNTLFHVENGHYVTNNTGEQVTKDTLDKMMNENSGELSQSQNIEKNKEGILKAYQLTLLGQDPKVAEQKLVDFENLLTHSSMSEQAKQEILRHGNIPGVLPTPVNSLGNTMFNIGGNAIQDQNFFENAKMWGNKVQNENSKLSPNDLPQVGRWEAEFNRDAKDKREYYYNKIRQFHDDSQGAMNEVNNRVKLTQQQLQQSNPNPIINAVPTTPKAEARKPDESQTGSRPPPATTKTEAKAEAPEIKTDKEGRSYIERTNPETGKLQRAYRKESK